MTDKVIVYVSSGDAAECEKIARSLIEKRLAACVSVIPGVRSFFRWEGEVKDDPEYLMLIKTSRSLFEPVRAEVELLHSYHTPEVICAPIVEGAQNYLTWMDDSLALKKEA